ncbi:putative polyketide synthase, partial [Aspergillus rambellii]
LGGAAIFPAAGHISLAVEALRQVAEAESRPVGQVLLRDVDISTALVIPETDTGVEIILRLEQQQQQQLLTGDNSTSWYAFSVESLSEGKWVSHSRGKISAGPEVTDKYEHPVIPSLLTQRVSGKRWYEALRRVGFQYGPTFQQLGQVRTDRRYQHAEAEVRVRNRSDVVQDESRYVIHPATIDACLQLIIISIHRGKHKEMPWGVVPIRLEEVTLRFPRDGEGEGSMGTAVAWTDSCEGRYFNTHTQLMAPSGRVLVDVKSLRCVAYEAAVPANAASNATNPAPFATISWKPDVLRLRASSSATLWPKEASEAQVLVSLVQMIHHRHPLTAVLLCGKHTPDTINAVSAGLPASCAVSTIQPNEQLLPENFESGGDPAVAWAADLVMVDESVLSGRPEEVLRLPKDGRWLIQSQPAESFFVMDGVENENALYPVLEVSVADPLKGNRLVRLFTRDHAGLVEAVHEEQLHLTILHETGQREDEHLVTHLSDKAHTAKTTTIDQFTLPANQAKEEAVIVDDRDGTLLNRLNNQSFEGLQSLIRANLPTVWLTRGVRQGACVFGGMVPGFLRVIRSEQASARIVLLDVDQETQPGEVAEAVLSVLHDAPTKDSGKDTEFWLHNGMMNIARVVPNHQLNTEWSPPVPLASRVSETKPLPDGVRLTSSTVDGQLRWSYGEPETSTALGSDEIEMQVLASELQQTTPNGPVVVSGRVLRCGSSVRADVAAAGDQVLGWTTESLATVVRTACYVRWDATTNHGTTKLLASVAALSKGVNMCITTARVGSNDRILALPGPVPTVHALVRLGKALGWDVRLVARSAEERQKYLSEFEIDGGGVLLADDMNEIRAPLRETDRRWVILAHDFSPLSQEVWRHLPARSVFVLNDARLESALDSAPFSRGASFMRTSVKTLHAPAASAILQQTLDLVQKYPALADNVESVYDISELSQSSSLLREIPADKPAVVTYRYHESPVRVTPEPPRLSFSPDASYLLVGCLGGLGRSLTRFMIERGARHFAFVSRSGTDKPEAAYVVDLVTSAGASVRVFRADAASESDMIRIVQEVHAERPLRGVVHAAMVLRDGVFEQMNCDRFQAAVNPKVQGAVSLSKALLQGGVADDLDFFVMTSSISATLGNPGQSNYSAANSFLDTLAWQHWLHHRPGVVSLVLPMVLDVGVVAENAALETALLRKGMYGVDEQEMLRGFEVAMSRRHRRKASSLEEDGAADTQIILGLEPAELAKALVHSSDSQAADASWYPDARFVHLRAEVERIIGQTAASSTSSGSGGLQSLLANVAVASAGRDEILTVIAQFIAQRVSRILLIAAEDFDLDGPSVASYGLDSMIGAEMRNWLFKEFGLEVSFQELLSASLTFKGLAEMVAVQQGVVLPGK